MMGRPLKIALAVLGWGLLASSARAGIFLPMGATTRTPGEVYAPPGATRVDSETVTFRGTANSPLSGALTVEVFRTVGGTLDFLYQLTNTTSANGAVSRIGGLTIITSGSAATFSASVDFATNSPLNFGPGAQHPVQASRSPDGLSKTFTFATAGILGSGLPTGATSNVLFIQTNATRYDSSGMARITSEANPNVFSTAVGLFEPAAVPEPSSLLLGGIAAGLLVGVLGWRSRDA